MLSTVCIGAFAWGAHTPRARAEAGAKAAPAPAKRTIAGFRMEGDPDIAMVFGDTESYKAHVDRFYDLEDQMRGIRGEFSRYVRATQTTLAAHKRRCPVDAVAPLYAQAYREGQRYRELGAEFESHYSAIRQLDKLGETSGLTPDYRWRVNRTSRVYKAALVDYREMRAAFDQELARDVGFHRCNADKLLSVGAKAIANGPPAVAAPEPKLPRAARRQAQNNPPPKVTIAHATFFIDNRTCKSTVRVFVDGALLGEVDGHAKAAFQALPGRHSLCLIPSTSKAACGDTGTVRTTHIHDGWAMALRCE